MSRGVNERPCNSSKSGRTKNLLKWLKPWTKCVGKCAHIWNRDRNAYRIIVRTPFSLLMLETGKMQTCVRWKCHVNIEWRAVIYIWIIDPARAQDGCILANKVHKRKKKKITTLIFSHLDQPSLDKGPFARSGHMVRKTLCWNASYTAYFPNKGKSGWTGPTGLLAFQHKLFRSMGSIWDLLYGKMTLFSCG